MKKALYYLLFLPIFLSAQTNKSDTLNLKASLSVTGFWQGGNVESLIFRANSKLSFKPWKNGLFENENSYVYQEFGKSKADEDILSLNFLRFNTDMKFSHLILACVSTNFRREIDVRYLVGAGASYQIFKKKENWLKFSLSFEYEQTDFNEFTFNRSKYNGNQSINTFRGTLWVNGRYHLFKDKVIFSHESYVQPSLEHSDNFRWRADVSLEIPVWKFLNFKINYLDTFESVVIENQKQEDKVLTFGFTIKNY